MINETDLHFSFQNCEKKLNLKTGLCAWSHDLIQRYLLNILIPIKEQCLKTWKTFPISRIFDVDL